MYLKFKKPTAMFLAAIMLLSAATACGKKEDKKPSEKTETENPKKDEKIVFKDAVGREVTLSKVASKAIADSPNTLRLYSYVMGVEGLIGISPREVKGSERRPYALAYRDEMLKLKHFGGNYAVENFEEVLLAKPDVFFSSSKESSAEYDKIQDKIGAPVVALDSGTGVVFDPKLYESITIIGKVMGREKRAKEVVDYMESLKKDLNDRTKDIPEDKKAKVYAGGLAWNGPHGIEGTRENYPLFDVVNAKNVVTGIGKNGLVEIDKEKILKWNPDFIFIDLASIDLIQNDYNQNKDYYKSLKAFKNENVYAQLPFVWCNVNVDTAMANAYYVGKIVYPEKFQDIDPIAKTNEIYKFLVGKPVYDEVAKTDFGGFQKITLEDLDSNKFFKKKK